MMEILYVVALILSAVLSTLAVLTHRFNDNFLQRTGLSVVAFASFAEMYLLYHSTECCQYHNSRSLFIMGFALYLAGTAWKVVRHGPKLPPKEMGNDDIRRKATG